MYDVTIIGGGPAGLTAAMYTARANLSTIILHTGGGALLKAESIENFYGIKKISGSNLYSIGIEQAAGFGAKLNDTQVLGIDFTENGFKLTTTSEEINSKRIVIATGAGRHTPKIKNILDFEGRGVSYCAICDGNFYRGKTVGVIGAGEYALHEVEDLLPLASKIFLFTNGDEIKAKFPEEAEIITGPVAELSGTEFTTLTGEKKTILSDVILKDGKKIIVDGIFVAVGIAGAFSLAKKCGIIVDEKGFINTDANCRTNITGIWAAGDCIKGEKQIVKAAYDGMKAGLDIIKDSR